MAELTSRERVRKALRFEEPDRVPFILGGCTSTGITGPAYDNLKKTLGITGGTPGIMSKAMCLVHPEESVLKALDIDIRIVEENPVASVWDKEKDVITDEWGAQWRRPEGGLYYDIINAPLGGADIDDIEKYPWPDLAAEERFVGLDDKAKDLYENSPYAIYAHLPSNCLYEMAWVMRGLQNMLLDLAAHKDFVHAIMRKVTDLQIGRTRKFLEKVGKYIDIFRTSDDVAMQKGLLFSPQTFRDLIKPYMAEYFRFIKENSNAKILYHSCGDVEQLIPDFIEIGVDILNPVQVSCPSMADTALLKEKYGDKLAFCGGVDTQDVMPNGTPKDVEEETRRRIMDLAPGGGYLLNSCHNIQPDVSGENIVAMYDAGKKYGYYPIEKK